MPPPHQAGVPVTPLCHSAAVLADDPSLLWSPKNLPQLKGAALPRHAWVGMPPRVKAKNLPQGGAHVWPCAPRPLAQSGWDYVRRCPRQWPCSLPSSAAETFTESSTPVATSTGVPSGSTSQDRGHSPPPQDHRQVGPLSLFPSDS